jgi:ribonuclease E
MEDRLITDGAVPLVATTAVEVALYILNQKRLHLNDIQQRYRTPITVTADEDMHISQFVIERAADSEIANGGGVVVHMDWAHHQETPAAPAPAPAAEGDGDQARRRSRRRRRGRRHGEGGAEGQRQPQIAALEPHDEEEETHSAEGAEPTKGLEAQEEGGAQVRKGPRRRGRRGGRRGRGGQRPPRAAGEEGRGETPESAEASPQNGAGRAAHAHEAPAKEQPEPQQREEQRLFETAAASNEQPAKSSEAQAEPEAPRRRGWWQR